MSSRKRSSPSPRRWIRSNMILQTARLWDATTGKPVGAPFKQGGLVYGVIFSPDMQQMLTYGLNGFTPIWNLSTHELALPKLWHEGEMSEARFSSDGRFISTANGKTMQLWDSKTGEMIAGGFEHLDWVNSVSVSPDGRRLLTASTDHTARAWEITDSGLEAA